MKEKIGGVRLAWDDIGQGLPVVLLHAFPLNRRMWERQRAELAHLRPQGFGGQAGRYRVITPDFRGHGESEVAAEDSTMERLAEDVRGLLDALGVERLVLGGLSMGGYVAFAFYRRYAARVAALVLADTRAGADTEEGRRGRTELAAVAEKEGSGAVAERMLPKLLGSSTQKSRPEVVAAVREMILSTSPAGIARALRGMAARPDSFELLPRINCPTLVLAGEEDVLTPPADAEAIANAIPTAKLTTIPNAGHLSNLEQPGVFNSALAAFLASLRL